MLPRGHRIGAEGNNWMRLLSSSWKGFVLGRMEDMFFILLRMNGMTNPNQFAKEMRDPSNPSVSPKLIRPNDNEVGELVKLYMSRKFK